MGGLIWRNKEVEVLVGNRKKSFIVRCVPFWYECFGLMFKSVKNAKPLLFSYKRFVKMSIFSWAIPFDFLTLWFDGENNLIDFRVVSPGEFGVSPNEKFKNLIEIPVTEGYFDLVDFILKNDKDKMIFNLK